MWTPQARQRPRSTAYETSGTLSYHAISCPQAMHADAGLTSDRLSGTRAATTFRKEPNASPGAKASAARPMCVLSAPRRYFVSVSGPTVIPVFGGIGAPVGMFLITGSGWNDALLNVASKLPMLIGPSTVTPFFTNVIVEDGCVHSEPWKVCALSWNVIDVALAFKATRA